MSLVSDIREEWKETAGDPLTRGAFALFQVPFLVIGSIFLFPVYCVGRLFGARQK